MRKLENNVNLLAVGKEALGMGGTVKLDGEEVISVNFQLHGVINEDVVRSIANQIRALAKVRDRWGV